MAHERGHAGSSWVDLVEQTSFGLATALVVLAAGVLIGGLACLAIAIGQAIAEWQGMLSLLP